MTAWREVLHAFVATWRAMLSDSAAMMLLFAGGIVYSFFYPLPYAKETVQRVPVAVVDQDRSALSRQITRYASAHPAIQVVAVSADLREAQDLIWRNEVAGMLFIPSGLQSKVAAGRAAEVEVAGNGIYMMLNKAALNGLAQAVGTVSAGIEIKRLSAATPSSAQAQAQRGPVGLNAVALFNVREGYGAYVVPAAAVLIIQQTLLLAVTLLFGTWAERGGFPVRRDVAGYVGMWCAVACVPILNSLYYFGFVFWWQDYPRGGNFGGLMLFTLLFAFAVSAFAIMVGNLFRSRERSAQLLVCTAMPIIFLSGVTWPVEALPDVLKAARWLIPSTPGIQGFVALNQLGASLHEVAAEAVGLVALMVASVSLGYWRWHRMEKAQRRRWSAQVPSASPAANQL
ncbi:ABC transporter permease [Ideonella sp. DXS29W]|uniref:ABC transporter permease n=1 Tax=Ideonella lacteola TaxID=2984193 RepID=A0ABU9BS98_9BURK